MERDHVLSMMRRRASATPSLNQPTPCPSTTQNLFHVRGFNSQWLTVSSADKRAESVPASLVIVQRPGVAKSQLQHRQVVLMLQTSRVLNILLCWWCIAVTAGLSILAVTYNRYMFLFDPALGWLIHGSLWINPSLTIDDNPFGD